jgi:actin-related protein
MRPVELFGNVRLIGGNCAHRGLVDRLQQEVTNLPNFPSKMLLRAGTTYEGTSIPWVGGSILASLSTWPETCISKAEYDETGPRIVDYKCF